MSAENIDLNSVIALLESKRAALDSAINALRAVLATGATGPTPEGTTLDFSVPFSASGSGGIPDGAFHGKSIPEAIRLYLELIRKKQTAREISEGLKKGGIESTAKYFDKMIYATLDRLKKSREIVKIGSEWGLPQWYPALMRASTGRLAGIGGLADNGQKPKRKGRPRKVSSKAKGQKLSHVAPIEAKPMAIPLKVKNAKSKSGPSDTIWGFLLETPGSHTAEEIRAAADIKDIKVATLLLGQLIKKGRVEKTEDGKYQSAKQ